MILGHAFGSPPAILAPQVQQIQLSQPMNPFSCAILAASEAGKQLGREPSGVGALGVVMARQSNASLILAYCFA
jgi:hypothetical protein